MESTAATPGSAAAIGRAEPITSAAITAYGAVCPLLPFEHLSYRDALRHDSGDTLAEFLVIELTEGAGAGSPGQRFDRAARQVERAIHALTHVHEHLVDCAGRADCLPLPLHACAAPVASPRAGHDPSREAPHTAFATCLAGT